MDTTGSITVANDIFFDELLKYLAEGKEVSFRLKGHSMRPFLRQGDDVTLTKAFDRLLKRGQIVLCILDTGEYVLHRIVRISGEYIILAGDGNLVQKEKVRRTEVLAIVVEVRRAARYIQINSGISILMARWWYLARPLRRVVIKLRSLAKTQREK